MATIIEVTINNWKKYQDRPDRKNYTWFKFDSDFFRDSKTITLSTAQQLLFVFMLCARNHGEKNTFSFIVEEASLFLKSTNEQILIDIKALEDSKFVTCGIMPSSCRHEAVIMPSLDKIRLDKKRLEKKETTSQSPQKNEVSGPVWDAYFLAFKKRYGVLPKRNATTNSQVLNIIKRLGKEEAVEIVKFYVGHNDRWYVRQGHSIGLCLKDAEKLHMEWKSGRKITAVTAEKTESLDHNLTVVQNYLNKTKTLESEREVNERKFLEPSSDPSGDL